MTKFNPENKESLSYGEALGPAMGITDKADALQYKKAYMEFQEKFLTNGVSKSGKSAEEIVNTNLGYYAGYYDNETRTRVEELFDCAHPVFGSIKTGIPTAEQAFEMGKQMAE